MDAGTDGGFPLYSILKQIVPAPVRQRLRLSGFLAQQWLADLITDAKRPATALLSDLLRQAGIQNGVKPPFEHELARMVDRERALIDRIPETGGRKVLLTPIFSYGNPVNPAQYAVMALALRLRGTKPELLICNSALPSCEFSLWGSGVPDPRPIAAEDSYHRLNRTCHVCTSTLQRFFDPLRFPVWELKELVKPGQIARLQSIVDSLPYDAYATFEHRGVPVGDEARATTLRNLRRGNIPDTRRNRYIFKRYLLSAMLMAELSERLFETVRPDVLLSIHGIYTSHGVLCHVAKKMGIEVVVWWISYRKNTRLFCRNQTYHRELAVEGTSDWENLILTESQERRLDDYLNSKERGTQDNTVYNPSPVADRERVIAEVGIDPALPLISLFTNVLWDGDVLFYKSVFSHQLDWLYLTIEHFRSRKDCQLAVRIHPGEIRGQGTSLQPLLSEITVRFPNLPEHIKIIPPESRVSSYTLTELSHAALVYSSNIGLEIAVRGIPVIVAGGANIRGKGISHDVDSPEEYLHLLDTVTNLSMPADAVARARRYAYYLYFQRMVPFKYMNMPTWGTMSGWDFNSLSELMPGQDPALDVICDGILKGTSFAYDEA